MIELNKTQEPDILANNKDEWTRRLLNFIESEDDDIPNNLVTKYNHPEVKESLKQECRRKCMYCESKVDHITYEHIEHVKPKAQDKYPDLTFEYENLGLACPICNNNKGAKYDEDTPFINPYEDNPEDYFYAYGAMIWENDGDTRAKVTKIELDLNRPELLEARRDRLEKIRGLIEEYKKADSDGLRNALLKEIKKETAADKPYSFCTSALFDLKIDYSN